MTEVPLVTAAVALLSGLFALLPATAAGRRKVLVLVIGPLALLALGFNWQVLGISLGVQENCEPNCVTRGDVDAARAVFVAAAFPWIAALVWFVAWPRRGADDEGE
jgi:amino acid permease